MIVLKGLLRYEAATLPASETCALAIADHGMAKCAIMSVLARCAD